jgi:hypothetical protein
MNESQDFTLIMDVLVYGSPLQVYQREYSITYKDIIILNIMVKVEISG